MPGDSPAAVVYRPSTAHHRLRTGRHRSRPIASGAFGAGLAALLAAVVVVSCADGQRELVLASTTSTQDSGLFDLLIPAFESSHPEYHVRVIAVGSGEALRLGARGDADVLLVHSPVAERAFMAEGHGASRRSVMYNDFVIVGPPPDPAGVGGMSDAAAALRQIAAAESEFISRGDGSGTHSRERTLWEAAGVEPSGGWYLEAGQGMGEVLIVADEKGAYTLSDRGTYLNLRDRLRLRVVVEGDAVLRNPYSVIVVTDARNLEGARAFAEWVTSEEAQRLIGRYGVDRFGRLLFHPDAAGAPGAAETSDVAGTGAALSSEDRGSADGAVADGADEGGPAAADPAARATA